MSNKNPKARETFFLSTKFPGYYYQLSALLGDGGMGVVYAALLKEIKTNKVT